MGNKAFSPSNDGSRSKSRGASLVSSLRRGGSLRRMSLMPRPHMESKSWLADLDLQQYGGCFSKFGGVEDFLYYDEASIKELGILHQGHRAKIMSSLTILREKYERDHKLKGVDHNPRFSLVEGRRQRRPLPSPIAPVSGEMGATAFRLVVTPPLRIRSPLHVVPCRPGTGLGYYCKNPGYSSRSTRNDLWLDTESDTSERSRRYLCRLGNGERASPTRGIGLLVVDTWMSLIGQQPRFLIV
nr:uncharacterized protein LOC113824651 [Penaeus vannamei]